MKRFITIPNTEIVNVQVENISITKDGYQILFSKRTVELEQSLMNFPADMVRAIQVGDNYIDLHAVLPKGYNLQIVPDGPGIA